MGDVLVPAEVLIIHISAYHFTYFLSMISVCSSVWGRYAKNGDDFVFNILKKHFQRLPNMIESMSNSMMRRRLLRQLKFSKIVLQSVWHSNPLMM